MKIKRRGKVNKIVETERLGEAERLDEVKRIDEAILVRLIKKIDSGCDPLYGYEKEKEDLEFLINSVFKHGESSSVIIYGARGSGKSTLLENCLTSLNVGKSSRHRTIIRLNGLIHNTDGLALSVIAQKLNIELTNASQIGSALQEMISPKSSKTQKNVLFILKEIDIFCRRQQTLLYTLFDTMHSVPGICLIGLTAKSDCLDYVEKRVRSRMLFHSIVLTSPFKTEEEYLGFIKEYLEDSIDLGVLKPLVSKQYRKSKTPGALKKFLLDLLTNYNTLVRQKKPLIADRKIELLESLAYLELAVVGLIAKKLLISHSTKLIFRPCEIFPFLKDIPSQITSSKDLFLFALSRLVDYGLVVINTNQRANSYISDWTSLSLNVEIETIKLVLDRGKGKLPTNFHKLLEITA